MAGYGAIISSGTLLAVLGHSGSAVARLGYYLLGSTLAMAAFMLLIELTERIRPPGAACWRSPWRPSPSRTSRKTRWASASRAPWPSWASASWPCAW